MKCINEEAIMLSINDKATMLIYLCLYTSFITLMIM